MKATAICSMKLPKSSLQFKSSFLPSSQLHILKDTASLLSSPQFYGLKNNNLHRNIHIRRNIIVDDNKKSLNRFSTSSSNIFHENVLGLKNLSSPFTKRNLILKESSTSLRFPLFVRYLSNHTQKHFVPFMKTNQKKERIYINESHESLKKSHWPYVLLGVGLGSLLTVKFFFQ